MLLAFLGLAVLLLGSTWVWPTTRTLGGGLGDPGIFTWSLRWTPFAIGRQISPLLSDYLNHPDGINLMWNTWVPLPGLLLAPLTLAFGPVLSFNVLLTLAYGLSAWSAYLAVRRYVPQAPLAPERVRFATTAFAVGLVVFGVLVAWPLKEQVTGQGRVHGDITEEVRGSSDLLAVVTPTRLSAIAPHAAIRRGDRFAGSREAYLGIPLLLVVAGLLVVHRSPVVGICATMLLVCMVLSLGSRLRVGGHPTPIRLPWTAIESLPLLRNMVPARFALLTALFAGLLLAVALDGLWWGGGWWRRAPAVVIALVVLASLAPAAPLRSSPVVATPAFFTTSAVAALPRDEVSLVVPFPQKGRANRAMLWQTEAGMWFKMPGGYFVGQGPDSDAVREAPPSTTSLALDRIQQGGRPLDLTPALRQEMARDFARWHVRSVVLGPMPHRRVMAGFLSDLLGCAPERVGGVELWGDAAVAPAAGGSRRDA
jgi:hypothetical protein